jgi:hypothetical protein
MPYVFGGIGPGCIDGDAEALDQALGVTLVPGRGQDDRRLAIGCPPNELARHGQRIEEQQSLRVLDRVR